MQRVSLFVALEMHVLGDIFDWLLGSDPEFSKDSYDQTIRLYPERCFIVMRDLEDSMKDDG